ncbi:hypothetical protein R3P38DRAFT_502378 [Favolaschia claudopus]|uniref:Uncharacterized protein n=1 Tax=Favolaschia claudopus TaxID=2862362 RepID=A0AAV9ZDC1_9AGAR
MTGISSCAARGFESAQVGSWLPLPSLAREGRFDEWPGVPPTVSFHSSRVKSPSCPLYDIDMTRSKGYAPSASERRASRVPVLEGAVTRRSVCVCDAATQTARAVSTVSPAPKHCSVLLARSLFHRRRMPPPSKTALLSPEVTIDIAFPSCRVLATAHPLPLTASDMPSSSFHSPHHRAWIGSFEVRMQSYSMPVSLLCKVYGGVVGIDRSGWIFRCEQSHAKGRISLSCVRGCIIRRWRAAGRRWRHMYRRRWGFEVEVRQYIEAGAGGGGCGNILRFPLEVCGDSGSTGGGKFGKTSRAIEMGNNGASRIVFVDVGCPLDVCGDSGGTGGEMKMGEDLASRAIEMGNNDASRIVFVDVGCPLDVCGDSGGTPLWSADFKEVSGFENRISGRPFFEASARPSLLETDETTQRSSYFTTYRHLSTHP